MILMGIFMKKKEKKTNNKIKNKDHNHLITKQSRIINKKRILN
jgi:hypothetical protein